MERRSGSREELPIKVSLAIIAIIIAFVAAGEININIQQQNAANDAKKNFGPQSGIPMVNLSNVNQYLHAEGVNTRIATEGYLQLAYEDISYQTIFDLPAAKGDKNTTTETDIAVYKVSSDGNFKDSPFYVAQKTQWKSLGGMGFMGDNRVTPPDPNKKYYIGGEIEKGKIKVADNNTVDVYYFDAEYTAPEA